MHIHTLAGCRELADPKVTARPGRLRPSPRCGHQRCAGKKLDKNRRCVVIGFAALIQDCMGGSKDLV